jgi:hypothetical protein
MHMSGFAVQGTLIATALLGFLAVTSFLVLPLTNEVTTHMRLSPTAKTLVVGETFTVEVIVASPIPVNVFAGDLSFDTETLQVESIEYNTSIADLWAEEPWYSNGAGTLNFAGGTTQQGGFTGEAPLITINFKTLKEGSGLLAITDAEILKHDGLGTDAEIAPTIDALFTIASPENLLKTNASPTTYAVVKTIPSTDLNNDGKQSIADISIFMMHLQSTESRFDFNQDGNIDLKDFNIILGR